MSILLSLDHDFYLIKFFFRLLKFIVLIKATQKNPIYHELIACFVFVVARKRKKKFFFANPIPNMSKNLDLYTGFCLN